ncbi:aa3-type cytochrome oxidase subunit II [Catellatospora tritici]|uniref:aa3-type cytochrome oxidase subunit II n=1 Tax=Catellatospora tritici TaxID=2851566 RepID=UPI001C2D6B7A|nr:cytochrome c oxidase subunit II [Catellatospora tritici]MBV1852555.1 cytochrome c oxidase subunit II [Catellatospora tritici]
MSIVAVTLLGGCDVGSAFGGFGWPEGGVTEQSQRMYDLWIGSVVAALLVGVFVWGLIFWCIGMYRRGKVGSELPTQTRFNLPIEILYTVLPFLVISVLFYYTAVIQTDVNKVSSNPDVSVDVVAFKWNWQFNYPESSAVGAPVVESTVGDSSYIPIVVIPINRTVRFREHSQDVIHSFWVPELLFKRDVFPGSVYNEFQVTATKEGHYVGRCAELCGTYHSMMNFELRTVTPEKFAQYVAALKAGKTTPEALASIGEAPYATTTTPFPTKRDADKG